MATAALAASYFSAPDRYLAGNYRLQIRAELVAEMLAKIEIGSAIDLGCGDGAVSAPLIDRCTALTLIDTSPGMLAKTRKRFFSNAHVRFRCADMHRVIEPHDTALCIGVLAHVGRTDAAIAAISRNVRVGGHALVQLTDAHTAIGALNGFLTRLRGRHYRRTDFAEVVEAAARAGLELVAVRRHFIVPAGLARMLGRHLAPIERAALKLPWLCRHGADAMLLFRRVM